MRLIHVMYNVHCTYMCVWISLYNCFTNYEFSLKLLHSQTKYFEHNGYSAAPKICLETFDMPAHCTVLTAQCSV